MGGQFLKEGNFMLPRAIYLHIPFCTNICHYCDFNTYVVRGQPVDDYLAALEREMAYTVELYPPDRIDSIFIGGGTPTILEPHQLERLLEAIQRYFPVWSEQIEFTVEANPGTTQLEKLQVMKAGGVNRLSFGAQTFRPDLLRRIGRVHKVEEIDRSVEDARISGIHNISLDLMFGLPDQRITDLEQTLQRTVSLSPSHISLYSLQIEEGTPFHTLHYQGKLPLPTEDEELAMYKLAQEFLSEAGYKQYEVSNFAQSGRESRHNLTYWHNGAYYGFGAGAHGYIHGIRHANVRGIKEYINRSNGSARPIVEERTVTKEESMEDFLILGLRLLEGVKRERFFQRYHRSLDEVFGHVIKPLVNRGLLSADEERIKLTSQGLLFGNEVFASFIGEAG